MVHIITNSNRQAHRNYDRAMAAQESKKKEMDAHYNIGEIDYDTPVKKDEYIGMLKDAQKRTKDSHLAAEIQKEIKHQKTHGSSSGLK